MSRSLRILVTLPYLPWPTTSGGKVRQFHLLRQMAQRGHRLSLLVQSKTEADEEVTRALSPWVEQVRVLPRRTLRHPLSLWHAATSGLPLLASINGHAPALGRALVQMLDQGQWDVVQIEHSYGFEPFEAELHRRAQPFVICEHNLESSLGGATYGKWPAPLRLLAPWDRWRARRWEQRVLSQAEAVIAVTQEDAQSLEQLCGRPTHVVPNGVDTAAFAQVEPDLQSQQVLFLGNYEYAPNVDAVEWALQEIWPQVWARRPQTRFLVCGHALPARWRQAPHDPRVNFMGYVDDLRVVQSGSAAFLVPLRFGGGSKLKVLEAMAAGLPMISTTQGLSGLQAVDGTHAVIADTAAGLADRVIESLDDVACARRRAQAARQHVQAHFDWAASADRLEAVYATLRRRTNPVRGVQ